MRSPIVMESRRLYVGGRRVHHFWVGLLIALSDLPDWRVWISDLRKP